MGRDFSNLDILNAKRHRNLKIKHLAVFTLGNGTDCYEPLLQTPSPFEQ